MLSQNALSERIDRVSVLSSFSLRLIAVLSMLIDHTAYVLVPYTSPLYIPMRSVGRIAFPIFCFLIVEGYIHTRSVAKYMLRLGCLALLSEIPFDLAFHGELLEFDRGQNVFLTLLLGLCAITAAGTGARLLLERLGAKKEVCGNVWIQMLTALPAVILCIFLAELLNVDYGSAGVIFICLFYLLRDRRLLAVLAMCAANILCLCTDFVVLPGSGAALLTVNATLKNTPQLYAAFAAIPLLLYSGKPGEKRLRNWFYAFYPLHLLVLYVLFIVTRS